MDDVPMNRNVSWRSGKDWQGIPWNLPGMYSREELRRQRLRYRSYRSCETPLDFYQPPVPAKEDFFKFFFNYGKAACSYGHFQLRHNVQAYSPEHVLFLHSNGSVQSVNPITGEFSILKPLKQNIKVIGFDAMDEFLVCAGYHGNFHVDTFDGKRVLWVDRIQGDAGPEFTNSCRLFKDDGELHVLSCSNDQRVRVHHIDSGAQVEEYAFEAPVNFAAVKGDLLATAIDDTRVPVVDRRTGQVEITCEGHLDHSFGVEWNPRNDFQFATCNQDKSVRIWDTRTRQTVHVLCSKVGGCSSLQFSRDGRYLAFGETIDFVHVYDTRSFDSCQIIDVFGNISGLSFTQFEAEPKALYVGLSDPTFASLVEFHNSENKILTDLIL